MSRIRPSKIVLGGLAAGIVILLSGLALASFVLGDEYMAKFKALFPQSPTRMFITHASMRLGFGLVIVFLYALVRPRFRSSFGAAALAGSMVWLLSYVPTAMTLRNLGLLAGGQFVIALLWGLAETILAANLGAYLCRNPRRF